MLGGYVFFSCGSAPLSEVRAVKTLAAGRQPKHVVSHLPFVECVASCTSSSKYRHPRSFQKFSNILSVFVAIISIDYMY